MAPDVGIDFSPGTTVIGGILYFVDAGVLMRSDGTETGTMRVWSSGNGHIGRIVSAGETIFFSASDARGPELWRSDGTRAGTELVRDINTGMIATGSAAGSSPSSPLGGGCSSLPMAACTAVNRG